MDKELLRVIIIFVGLVVIAGMIIWGMIKSRRAERKLYYGDKDAVEVVPLGSALDEEPFDSNYAYEGDSNDAYDDGYEDDYTDLAAAARKPEESSQRQAEPEPSPAAPPDIIQFGIVSKEQAGFNGMQLAVAFKSAGLSYGPMKIFESLNAEGEADFSAASIVEPGTFPETGLDQFYCPGIVLFMQPDLLDDPVAVFDQLIAVVHKLAKQLDGVEWDQRRKPLTEESIHMLREQLF
ncbi:MAG: cell division protein ZipA C-terminal FtsZ-binding domain-containing protein [Gammaproteobacteria bacterium]